MSRLSVIVPCYQIEPYARQTLLSLSRNAFPGVQFVLVDDASTDTTPALLAEWAAGRDDTVVLTHPVNRGLAAARNSGVDAADGDHLTFLDGDDWYAPGYLAELLATIERLGCDMVRTDHVQVRGRTREIRRIAYGPRGVVGRPRDAILPAHRMTSVDAPNAWAGIYHRRLVDRGLLHFAEELRTCEDRPWAWRLHLQAESFAVVGLLGVCYRREVATSLTQITDERQLDFVPAFEAIVADVLADPDGERLLPKALRSYCAIVCHHLERRSLYPRALAEQLTERTQRSLRAMPRAELRTVIAGLDPEREHRLRRLVAA